MTGLGVLWRLSCIFVHASCALNSAQTPSTRNSLVHPFLNIHESAIVLTATPSYCHVSHSPGWPFVTELPTCSLNNALKAYEKQTKNDLLSHPLAAQLQACPSPSSILIMLQQQVQQLSRSRTSDDRLTKWLDPTVNVLHAFSETLREGVSLVWFKA